MADQAKLMAQLGLDTSPYDAALDMAGKKAGELGRHLERFKSTIAGAFSVGAIVAWGSKVVALADQVSELSEAAGLSTDQFQALAASARANGIEDEKLLSVISKLRDMQGQVAGGNEKAAAMFERLGISVESVRQADVPGLLLLVAQAAGRADSDASVLSATMDLMGTQVTPRLLASLRDLSSGGWGGLVTSMKEAGQVMDEVTLRSLKNAEDRVAAVQRKLLIWTADFLGGMQALAGGVAAAVASKMNGGTMAEGWKAQMDAFFEQTILKPSGSSAPPPAGSVPPPASSGRTGWQDAMRRNERLMLDMKLDEMDAAGKLLELEQERARLLEEEGNADAAGQNAEFLQFQYERLQVEREIARLRRSERSAEVSGAAQAQNGSAGPMRLNDTAAGFERIGGMIRPGANLGADMQRRHITIAQLHLEISKRIAVTLEKLHSDGIGGYAP